MSTIRLERTPKKVLFKRCHRCGKLIESYSEVQRCPEPKCQKAFLPLNYLHKIEDANFHDYPNLFVSSDELHEDDLIKGIYVLW